MFFMKTAILWHLLKMFASEAWNNIKPLFQGLKKHLTPLLRSPQNIQTPNIFLTDLPHQY